MGKKITTIPATKTMYMHTPVQSRKKRRACGYARVSTDHEDQQTSYEAQLEYYTNYIQGRDDMDFVGMYSDEAITGTSTKHRDGFSTGSGAVLKMSPMRLTER